MDQTKNTLFLLRKDSVYGKLDELRQKIKKLEKLEKEIEEQKYQEKQKDIIYSK